MTTIKNAWSNFEIEPLVHPFGFKGHEIKKIWQYSVELQSVDGLSATGMGCQGVLWSDCEVFAANSPSAGCAMMYLVTDYAVQLLKGLSFETPFDAMDQIFPEVISYAKSMTRRENLSTTFVLNALVGVDLALWKLYEKKNGHKGFDAIIPENIRPSLSNRYERIQIIPLISYGVTLEEVKELAEEGFFFLKIKIGSDPEKDGDNEKMLAWDKQRLSDIHSLVKDIETPYTKSGHIAYYLDANGRYDSKERLWELLNHARDIGMLERIVLVEEPFRENNKCYVGDFPVLIAADESAHSPEDVAERIQLGYRAIALKPIAKTMSITFRMIEEAQKHDIPCFCADLTVGPLQVEVNKNFAARLACLPGLKMPVVESNGWQNYINWKRMQTYSPANEKPWSIMEKGGYQLGSTFYEASGSMFEEYPHYHELALEK